MTRTSRNLSQLRPNQHFGLTPRATRRRFGRIQVTLIIVQVRLFRRTILNSRLLVVARRMFRGPMFVNNRNRQLLIRTYLLTIRIRRRQTNSCNQLNGATKTTRRNVRTHVRLFRLRQLSRMVINANNRTFSLILPITTYNRSRSQRNLTLQSRLTGRIRPARTQRPRVSRHRIVIMLAKLMRNLFDINRNLSRVTVFDRANVRIVTRRHLIFSSRWFRGTLPNGLAAPQIPYARLASVPTPSRL